MVKSSCDVARVCPKRTAIARHAKAPPVVRLSFCQGSLWLERWWRGACLDQLFECEAIASPPYRDFLQVRFRWYHYCRPGCRVSNPHEEGDPSSPTIPTTITRHDWALTWASRGTKSARSPGVTLGSNPRVTIAGGRQAVAAVDFLLPAMKAPKCRLMKGTISMTMVVAMKGTSTRLRCHISQPGVSGIRM